MIAGYCTYRTGTYVWVHHSTLPVMWLSVGTGTCMRHYKTFLCMVLYHGIFKIFSKVQEILQVGQIFISTGTRYWFSVGTHTLDTSSVADPGSGAFLPLGSGIRIRDGAMVGSGSEIKHPGSATLDTSDHFSVLIYIRLCPWPLNGYRYTNEIPSWLSHLEQSWTKNRLSNLLAGPSFCT
jgi:hypothetical protein